MNFTKNWKGWVYSMDEDTKNKLKEIFDYLLVCNVCGVGLIIDRLWTKDKELVILCTRCRSNWAFQIQ